MAVTSFSTLLGFALPTTGDLTGTWGDTVNTSVTALIDSAVAGTATASVASANWTLTTAQGVANEARAAILIPTGSPGVSRNITAPSQSKAYIVVNQSNAAVVVKGAATTGVTIAVGVSALVAWNGTDFVNVTGQTPQPVTTFNNQTASYTLVATDGGSIVSFILAAAATCTLPVASSFPTGWFTTITNNSTTNSATAMVLTLSPASGTIDGIASIKLVRGESRRVISNGANWLIESTNTMRGYSENITPSTTLRIKATGVNAVALGYGTLLPSSGSNTFTIAQGPSISNTMQSSVAIGSFVTCNEIGKWGWSPPGCSFGTDTAQWSYMVLGAETVAASGTTYVMTSDGNAAGGATPNTTNQLVIPLNTIIFGSGILIGKMAGTLYVVYDVKFNALNNAGTVTLPVGTLTLYGTNTLAATTAPTITIDTVNDCVKFTSGAKTSGTSIRWNAFIEYREVAVA